MARKTTAKKTNAADDCDLCHEKGGRNSTVVHILSFDDYEALIRHLNEVFPDTKYCVEFYANLWSVANEIYRQTARERYEPLWVVYLEAHGVKINNREAAIKKHRGVFYREFQEPERQTSLLTQTALLKAPREPGED